MFKESNSKMSKAAYKSWQTMWQRTHNFTDEELYDYLGKKYMEQEREKDSKRVRDTIRLLGGVNDPDFERIPLWAKRKEGRPLDEIASELSQLLPEYQIEDSNDVYELLIESGA
ncbi:MAG: hypothetical protein WBA71_05270 [Candidatus Humimicrobiia bacterium]